MIKLVTPRMILREMTLDDIENLREILADPEVMRFYPSVLDTRGIKAWIRKNIDRYNNDGIGIWGAILKETNEFIGQIGPVKMELNGKQEISIVYLLKKEFQGKSFATEGAAACRDYIFKNLGYKRIAVPIRPENTPSIKVIKRLNFTLETNTTHAGYQHQIYISEIENQNPTTTL